MSTEATYLQEAPLSAVVRGFKDGFNVLVTQRSTENNLVEVLDGVDTIIGEMRRRGYLPSWNVETNGKLLEGEPKAPELPKVEEEKQAEVIPVCPTHNKQMVKRQGQWGEFWACPTKDNQTGEWCKYKPNKKK